MKFPSKKRAKRIARDMKKKSGFRGNVCTIIDGTHFPVQCPSNDYLAYYNRKGWTLLNALVGVDSENFFTYVDSSFPGAAHDSRVLKNSSLYRAWETDNYRPCEDIFIAK